ncbi:MAG: integrase core domain-containing protein [Dehalococcoidales bacterium]|nr:integrase core domain-containing protein [Dehalococcoidales bacterium]
MKQIYVASYFKSGYSRFMKYVHDVFDHPKQKSIEQRLEIIKFSDEFGFEAAKRAFGKSRSTIYLWKQKLKNSGGKLSALAPGNRTPRNKRHRVVDPFIERFIVNYRSEHHGADKTTITPALGAVCSREGLKPVSESTIGRIIHDLKAKGRLPYSNKISIRGGTGTLLVREAKQRRKKLRRKDYVPRLPGDLVQMDTVAIFSAGLKRYIFTAIDVRTRFAFAYAYKANSSANATNFIEKFLQVTPFATRRVQTDNGSEFLSHFDHFCSKHELTHFFNYPRHPESNGFLERFNRTIQEQCVSINMDYLDEPDDFNRKLMDYLIWYNTEKPHRGIGKVSPMRYYLDNFCPLDQSNMLWTLT